MSDYAAPLRDIRFAMTEIAGLDGVIALPGMEEISVDLVDAVLTEAGRFADEAVAPLNRVGDIQGAVLENGVVRTADGFRETYRQFCEGGWNGAPFDPDYGGQGLPWLVSTALTEMWQSACLSFSLAPLLTQGAVDLLANHGSDEQKDIFLEKMISGEWAGTMNLTEPQAGSDVGALATRAVPAGDGTYRISGQKIFISYGDQDFTDNIVHMVLARTPDAPRGIRGVSLFIVPKVLVNEDGSLGARNDLRPVGLEHKLGIHGSPTCVMAYGEGDGALGTLVGEENCGIRYMFTMMNNARLGVGLQGVAVAERAYQQARAFAMERVQGRDETSAERGPVPILHHPDVRRMLMTMKAQIEAMRALCYWVAADLDRAQRTGDAEAQARVDLMIPVVKAWCSDLGVEIASLGVQVHGGMGFIEETGAAQHMRDSRIAPIYEGTNGIQAMDLVARKLARDGGEALRAQLAFMRADSPDRTLAAAIDAVERAAGLILGRFGKEFGAAAAAAVPFCNLLGLATGGWLLTKGAAAAERLLADGAEDTEFLKAKRLTARFYAQTLLPQYAGLLAAVEAAGGAELEMAAEQF